MLDTPNNLNLTINNYKEIEYILNILFKDRMKNNFKCNVSFFDECITASYYCKKISIYKFNKCLRIQFDDRFSTFNIDLDTFSDFEYNIIFSSGWSGKDNIYDFRVSFHSTKNNKIKNVDNLNYSI